MPQRSASSTKMVGSKRLGPATALVLWGALCLGVAFYGNWAGYGGRPFAATLTAFAILLGGELCLASPALREAVQRTAGPQGGVLLALWPLAAYAVYAFGTGTASYGRFGIAVAYTLVPLALVASAHADRGKAGAWQDYAAMLAIFFPLWLTVKLGVVHFNLRTLFPYPEPLGYVLTMLLAINVGLATFLFIRRMDGAGYSIGWSGDWAATVSIAFAILAAIDIPLALKIHFVRFDPHAANWRGFPLSFLEILIFTAWPEEFLFRGLLQNSLGKTLRNEYAGWIAASVIFGLSHIHNGHFPNWRYVALATIAGVFYGYAWRRTASIFPSAIVHTLVDATWRLLFPTL
jgi:membrane protease YdiL (CAAX protease family)